MIRNAYWVMVALALLAGGCVSSKRYKTTQADHQARQDSLLAVVQALNIETDTLRQALLFERGANYALLLTQDKLQDRLDLLQAEIDRLSNNASATSQSLNSALRRKDDEIAARQAQLDGIARMLQTRTERLATVAAALAQAPTAEASPPWESRILAGQLLLSIPEDKLFRTGSTSALLKSGETLLNRVATALEAYPEMQIHVVGHTDNKSVNRQGLDNWQYSALRAVTVAKFLTEAANVGANRVTASGKAQFGPIESNETAEGRQRNRRVDLIIHPRDTDLERDVQRVLGE